MTLKEYLKSLKKEHGSSFGAQAFFASRLSVLSGKRFDQTAVSRFANHVREPSPLLLPWIIAASNGKVTGEEWKKTARRLSESQGEFRVAS